jgi:tRNA threonylcarbamoyladenosine modification (KEOPS) complex  Pcc1 subunit
MNNARNKVASMKWILAMTLAAYSLCSFASVNAPKSPRTGIAGGNHMMNSDFDFKLTIPNGWGEEKAPGNLGEREALPVETWRISNIQEAGPTNTSRMQVEFYSTIEAKDIQALRAYVEAKYPEHKWTDHVDSRLAGLRSNETPDPTDAKAKIGHLFYFMDRNMIVGIQWRRHPDANGDRGISELLLSMDRRTAPPILKSISYSRTGPLKPGDPLCIYLNVDDLKSSFESSSLKKLIIAGLPKNFIWHDVTWDESNARFNICLKLPTAIRNSSDLTIIRLELSNERERALSCFLEAPSTQLRCDPWLPSVYPVEQASPPVENANPDRQAPVIDAIDIDQATNKVTLNVLARDASGIASGWLKLQQIPGESSDIFIAPWQMQNGQFDIDLTRQSTSGTRRVSSIALMDTNGIGTIYVDCNLIRPEGTQKACRPGFYARCLDGNICEPTGLPIVEYFSSKRR